MPNGERPDELGVEGNHQRRHQGLGAGLDALRAAPGAFFLTPVRASGTSGVATGILSLYHGDRKAGEGRIKNQPGYFELAGEGLWVGRDSGVAVIVMEAPGRHH
jgi:hypothetical protein